MKRRILAVLLAAATVLTSVPAYAAEPVEAMGENCVMQLEFEGNVADSIASERQTVVKKWSGDESINAQEGTDYQFVEGIIGEKALQLNGGSYLSLGAEADLNPSNLTFSCWINPQEKMTGEQILVWNKQLWNQDGWYLSSLNDEEPLVLSIGTRVYEVHMSGTRDEFFPAGVWTHIAVTFDNETKKVTMYRNGESQFVSTGTTADQIVDNGAEKAIGYNGSEYKGSYLKARLDQVILLDTAANADQIAKLYEEGKKEMTDAEIVVADKSILNPFSGLNTSAITADISLPEKGANGSTITWESTDKDVISETGKVVRQAEDTEVTLTAVIKSGDVEDTKSFTVTVKKKPQLTEEEQLWVSYDMTVKDGKLVDSQGRGDAALVGLSAADVTTAENGEKQLNFTDNANHSKYVKLPQEIIEQGDESFTIDMKFNTSQKAFAWIFNLGTKGTADYVFLNPIRAWGPTVLSVKSSVVSGDEHNVDVGDVIEAGADTVATMVFNDNQTAQLYINGKLIGSVNHGCNITDILENGVTDPADAIGYLGLSLYGADPGYEGTISRFDVYNYAMTEKEVALLYVDKYLQMADEERVAADVAELKKNLKEGELTASELELPDMGMNGSKIVWESSKKDVIAEDGAVTRPAIGKPDEAVTLTATVSRGEVSQKVTFDFNVLAVTEMQGMEDFELGTVDVTNSYYAQISQKDIDFLKTFDADRLLSRFRETAGLDTKGVGPYTGWENSYIGGHTLGHYMTACAQAYLTADNAGDKAWMKTQLDTIISGLKACQDAVGTGFIFGAQIEDKNNIEKQFDIMEGTASGGNWVPWYTMHKILAGLVDVYKYTDNDEALAVASNLGDWIYNRVSKWDDSMKRRVLGIEYGGMNDCLYELYKYSGKAEHAKAAAQFDETWLFESVLSGNANVLNGKHANTQIPKFVGALNRYRTLNGQMLDGEEVDAEIYLEYVEAFWDMVVNKHTYITGGNSEWEHFGADNILDAERTQCNCETCNTYNMLKMTRELYKITGDKKYADYYENTFINAIISSINPETGMTTYFQPMATGYFKVYGNTDVNKNQFWCCTGSGMENFTKLGDSIYYKKGKNLYVTQYLSSEAEWKEQNIKLTQTTSIPDKDTSKFTVHVLGGKSADMNLYLRIPDWIAGEPTVTVNGKKEEVVVSGGYVCLDREWADGDTVEIQLPMEVRAYGLPDDETVFGFKYGPVVLSAELGTEEMDKFSGCGASVMLPGSKIVNGSQAMPKDGKRAVLGTETLSIEETTAEDFIENINEYLVRVDDGDELRFELNGTDQKLVFSAHYRQHTQRYGIYWYFTGNDLDPAEAEARILAQKEEGRTNQVKIDVTKAGYGQYEFDDLHQLWENGSQGTSSDNELNGMTSRYAVADKDFSYRMAVNKEKDNYIVAKLAKIDNGKTLKITIEGQIIYEEVLNYSGDDAIYEVKIPIPDEIVQKAQTVSVTEGDGNQKDYDVLRIYFSGKAGENSARLVEEVYIATGYSNHAEIESMQSDVGTTDFDAATKTYTVTVPEETEKAAITTKIADTYGLLYIDGKLVNDSIAQKFDVKDEASVMTFRVYGEDHETYADYTVKVVRQKKTEEPEAEIVSLAVTAPEKTEYKKGENLDFTGMKVTANYSDGSVKDIAVTDCEVSGYDKTKTGEQTVTVTYEGKTATFKVTVKEAEKPDTTDKTALEAAVKAAIADTEKAKYTEESWAAYEEALNQAKEVLADTDATQKEIDDAAAALDEAAKALQKKELPYVDVVKGDWFYDGAYYNYFAGTMTGTDPTHFSPYATLVRAQFATILYRLNGEPKVEYETKFPDVPDGQFYSKAVIWAAEAEVVTGYTDSGYFGTNDPITREQMVTMMYRYADHMGYESEEPADISKYTDADKVTEFAEAAMKWAVGNGIIEGKENTDGSYRLDPQGNTSRAECSIIIQRFMETFGE